MVHLWRLAAEQENALAQNNLGYCYEKGIVVDKDLNEAVRLYSLAAEKGNPSGQNNLGYCYKNGIGVEKNLKEAVRLYRLAADQGNASAQNNLGYCYECGDGVKKSFKEAMSLYHLAADQGNASAQNSLDFWYKNILVRKKEVKSGTPLCYPNNSAQKPGFWSQTNPPPEDQKKQPQPQVPNVGDRVNTSSPVKGFSSL